MIKVVHSGMYTSVQDDGRVGRQAVGVPQGGYLDLEAANLANWLVGNEEGTPVLEMTLQGPVLQFEQATSIALTGADLSPRVNDKVVTNHTTLHLQAGDKLSFGPCKYGCRGYLAIAGQWTFPEWLASQSYLRLVGENPTATSLLSRGQYLAIAVERRQEQKQSLRELRRVYPRQWDLLIWPGPEYDRFTIEEKQFLLENWHLISQESNRMGCQLSQLIPNYQVTEPLISSGVLPGTIQITNAGRPVILLADAQTTGGYYRFGQLTQTSIQQMAQVKPGDKVRFSMVET